MWFTGCADELAQLLVDARACAEACEAYLDARRSSDAVALLAAPAAVSRILIELIDQPPEIVRAAVLLSHELAVAAAAHVNDAPDVREALERLAASAERLLEATG